MRSTLIRRRRPGALPEAFTIAGTHDTSVEALPVVGATGDAEPAPETTVEVTGTVQEAVVPTGVEEDVDVDLDDALFAGYADEDHVVASDVGRLEDVDRRRPSCRRWPGRRQQRRPGRRRPEG